jgi:hypothetical protein
MGSRRINLGIIANEFFDSSISTMGGFGWAARQVTRCFTDDPSLGVDVTLVSGLLPRPGMPSEARSHGVPIIFRDPSRLAVLRRMWSRRFDLLLTIDYRPTYRAYLKALPRTPVVVWVRDPRPPEDWAEIAGLRIPGADGAVPSGIQQVDCRSLAAILREGKHPRLNGRCRRETQPHDIQYRSHECAGSVAIRTAGATG